MKRLGQAETSDERNAEAAIAAVAEWAGRTVTYAPLPAGLASPSHRGVDSTRWSVAVDADTPAFFLKVIDAEQLPFTDVAAGFAAAAAAAGIGATPQPLHLLAAQNAIVCALLPAGARTARMDDLRRPEVLSAVIDLKRSIHGLAPFAATFTIFDQLRRFDAARQAGGIEGPADLWWMLDWASVIEKAILAAGSDLRPSHGDGLASNVMLGADGQAWLVDFDQARNDDPYCEIGALLNEAFQFESEMLVGLEMFEGSVCQASLNRCRAYAIVDDLVWGIWGMLMDRVSPRGEIEFLKYAQWRLLRCRMALRHPGLEEKLRRL